MTTPGRIKVAIVEDERAIRQGLAVLLDASGELSCCGNYGSMEEALDRIPGEAPDVVLTDLGLPGMPGVEGIRRLHAWRPHLPIVVLSVYDDDDRISEALCAGACGYVLKSTSPERLLSAIRDAAAGRAPLSPEVARRLGALFDRAAATDPGPKSLSRQERRLLLLFEEGHSDGSAAEALGLDADRVAALSRSIHDKLAAIPH